MTEPDYEQIAREFWNSKAWMEAAGAETEIELLAVKFREIAEAGEKKGVADFLAARQEPDGTPTRLKPGMRIGPGHYRTREYTLKEKCEMNFAFCECWMVMETHQHQMFYLDDLYKVIQEQAPVENLVTTPAPPQSEWKVGQKVVGPTGKVHRLCSPVIGHDAAYQHWGLNGWGPIHKQIHFSLDEYKPWPRAGDWVRCTAPDHSGNNPFQVRKVFDTEFAKGVEGSCDNQNFCKMVHLEPASPPVEPKPDHEADRLRYATMQPPVEQQSDQEHYRNVVNAPEPPKPTLEGEHWDDVVSSRMLTFKGQQLNKCLLDLRVVIQELQKELECLKQSK